MVRGHLYQLIHYRDRFAVPPSFRSAFLLALMKVTTVNLTKLANALNGKVKQTPRL